MIAKKLYSLKSLRELLLICLSFTLLTGCLGLGKKPIKIAAVTLPLKLTADSGYLSKQQVLPFLTSNKVTDTLSGWWGKWKPADTMGKYYKEENGGYLICVLSADNDDNVAANKLIETDKNGIFLSTKDFYCDWCNINRRTDALHKVGRYFITYTCGHGASFSSSWFSLFTKLSERGEQILESQYSGSPQCQSISSHWKLTGDTCTVVYTVDDGVSSENGCVSVGIKTVSVRYCAHNGTWRSPDSLKIADMHIAQ